MKQWVTKPGLEKRPSNVDKDELACNCTNTSCRKWANYTVVAVAARDQNLARYTPEIYKAQLRAAKQALTQG